MDKETDKIKQEELEAEKQYRGAAVDNAEDDNANDANVNCDVRALNNNPRNNDIDL